NAADPEVLEDFLGSSIRKLNNDGRYLIALSGHGSGAIGDFLRDDSPRSSLKIPDLTEKLDGVRNERLGGEKFDILGMDSCLMSMAEVCYELSDSVHYLVGAEGYEREGGWPYHSILEALDANPGMSTEKAVCTIVERYIKYYS